MDDERERKTLLTAVSSNPAGRWGSATSAGSRSARATPPSQRGTWRMGLPWVSGWYVQRRAAAQGQLGRERIRRLESVEGWVWSAFDARWEAGFRALSRFASIHGNADAPKRYREKDFELGQRVGHQRRLKTFFRAGKLSADRIARPRSPPRLDMGHPEDDLIRRANCGRIAEADVSESASSATTRRVVRSRRAGRVWEAPVGRGSSTRRPARIGA